eukprot:gnl/TRDRNA2_/TRDRNA2_41353_c0_seq1.p1 gnl/TRDRNA2_/TRDRNA2_41353_c0~~gnl/TRDRNA2_/TRDRNA2_41353_c0_seq1.p1  ORF type:complete len:462 (-),score=130.39 gnl/TRDRNA2_/TRDRNA2_41353_c0_seq1:12-1397(-)
MVRKFWKDMKSPAMVEGREPEPEAQGSPRASSDNMELQEAAAGTAGNGGQIAYIGDEVRRLQDFQDSSFELCKEMVRKLERKLGSRQEKMSETMAEVKNSVDKLSLQQVSHGEVVACCRNEMTDLVACFRDEMTSLRRENILAQQQIVSLQCEADSRNSAHYAAVSDLLKALETELRRDFAQLADDQLARHAKLRDLFAADLASQQADHKAEMKRLAATTSGDLQMCHQQAKAETDSLHAAHRNEISEQLKSLESDFRTDMSDFAEDQRSQLQMFRSEIETATAKVSEEQSELRNSLLRLSGVHEVGHSKLQNLVEQHQKNFAEAAEEKEKFGDLLKGLQGQHATSRSKLNNLADLHEEAVSRLSKLITEEHAYKDTIQEKLSTMQSELQRDAAQTSAEVDKLNERLSWIGESFDDFKEEMASVTVEQRARFSKLQGALAAHSKSASGTPHTPGTPTMEAP